MFPSSFGCRMMVGRNANEVSKTLEFCLRMRYYLHATLIKIRRDCYAYVLVKNDGFYGHISDYVGKVDGIVMTSN